MKNVEYFGVFLYPNVCLVPACGRGRALTDLEIGITHCTSVDNKYFSFFVFILQAASLPHVSGRVYITV